MKSFISVAVLASSLGLVQAIGTQSQPVHPCKQYPTKVPKLYACASSIEFCSSYLGGPATFTQTKLATTTVVAATTTSTDFVTETATTTTDTTTVDGPMITLSVDATTTITTTHGICPTTNTVSPTVTLAPTSNPVIPISISIPSLPLPFPSLFKREPLPSPEPEFGEEVSIEAREANPEPLPARPTPSICKLGSNATPARVSGACECILRNLATVTRTVSSGTVTASTLATTTTTEDVQATVTRTTTITLTTGTVTSTACATPPAQSNIPTASQCDVPSTCTTFANTMYLCGSDGTRKSNCVTTADGEIACIHQGFCSSEACATDSDCDTSEVCALLTCCNTPVCLKLDTGCANPLAVSRIFGSPNVGPLPESADPATLDKTKK